MTKSMSCLLRASWKSDSSLWIRATSASSASPCPCPPVGVRDAGDGECRPAHSCDRCPPAQQLPSVHLGAGHANSFPNFPAVAFGAGTASRYRRGTADTHLSRSGVAMAMARPESRRFIPREASCPRRRPKAQTADRGIRVLVPVSVVEPGSATTSPAGQLRRLPRAPERAGSARWALRERVDDHHRRARRDTTDGDDDHQPCTMPSTPSHPHR